MTDTGIIGAQCVNLSVADMDRAEAWYRDILAFRTLSRERYDAMSLEIAFLELQDFFIELIEFDGAEAAALYPDPPRHASKRGLTHFGLQVGDADAMAAELATKGVPILFGPREMAQMKLFFVRDPDGNLVKFVQRLG